MSSWMALVTILARMGAVHPQVQHFPTRIHQLMNIPPFFEQRLLLLLLRLHHLARTYRLSFGDTEEKSYCYALVYLPGSSCNLY